MCSRMDIFIIVFAIVSTSQSIPTRIYWTPMKWDEANQFCVESSQNLHVVNDLDSFSNLTLGINASGDVTLWIGGKERRKFFIWNTDQAKLVREHIGCFKSDIQLAEAFNENQPTMCMSYCKHRLDRPFAGLSGNKCACYDGLHDFVQVLDKHCDTPCPGDGNYICGAENITTIYRSEGTIKWKLYEPGNANTKREDCVVITKDQEQQITWYPVSCNDEYQYICRIFDETICQFKGQSTPPCYFQSVENTSWFEAVRKCSSMGGYLAGKDILENESFPFRGTTLWTSLTRIRQRWINDQTINNLLPRSEDFKPGRTGCLSLRRRGNKWFIQARSCNEKLPFICNSAEPIDITSKTVDNASAAEQQKKSLSFDIILGIAVAGVGIITAVLVLCYCWCKRNQRNTETPAPQDHFYFILEKESVYNTISVNSQGNPSVVVNNSMETYYDCLAFVGTIQYSEQQRRISGQDVDYHVYNRTSDVTNEYDVLQFEPSIISTGVTSDNYHKVIPVIKGDSKSNR